MNLYDVRYIVPLITMVALCIGCKKRFTNPLWMYLLFSLLVDLLGIYFTLIAKTRAPSVTFIIFVFIEIFFFLYYYYKYKIISVFAFIILLFITFGFMIYRITLNPSFPNIMEMRTDYTGYGIVIILFVMLSLKTFYVILKEQRIPNVLKLSLFWGNTAIFIYSACTLLMMLFINFLRENYPVDLLKIFWLFGFLIFVATKNILIAFALHKNTIDVQ